MLASAAAGSVLEIGYDVHQLGGLCFSIFRKVFVSVFPSSGRYPLPGYCFCPDPYGPDEAQQFTSNCGGDLSLVLAGCGQSHIPFVQPVLRLPRNLFRFFGDTLLSFAQSIPDTGWTTIVPCGFDDDSPQVRVAGFSDAPASRSLAAGVFAGHSTAITHQLPSTVEAGHMTQLGCNSHS